MRGMGHLWQLVVLGAVQGLTEFLPVSSSAHLVFAEYLLGLRRPGLVLEAVLHLGTVGAVLVLYGRDLFRLLRAWAQAPLDFCPDRPGRVVWLLGLTTGLTAVVGLLFREPLESSFDSVRWTALQLGLTGLLLWTLRPRGDRSMVAMTWQDAGWIGLAQAVSIVPGISRSGITIAVALWRGIEREDAARYSFLAAVPALLGAGAYALARDWQAATSLGYTPGALFVGFVSALTFGTVAILWLVDVLRRGRLRVFAYYCWIVAGLMFALALHRGA